MNNSGEEVPHNVFDTEDSKRNLLANESLEDQMFIGTDEQLDKNKVQNVKDGKEEDKNNEVDTVAPETKEFLPENTKPGEADADIVGITKVDVINNEVENQADELDKDISDAIAALEEEESKEVERSKAEINTEKDGTGSGSKDGTTEGSSKDIDPEIFNIDQDEHESDDEDEFKKFPQRDKQQNEDELIKKDKEAKKQKAKYERIERSKISADVIDFYDTIVLKLYKKDERKFYRLCDEDENRQLYWVDESKPHKGRNFHAYKMKIKPKISIHKINTKINYLYLPGDPNFVKFDPNDYDKVVEIEESNYEISQKAVKNPLLLNQVFYMESESTRNFMPKNVASVDGEDKNKVFPESFMPLE